MSKQPTAKLLSLNIHCFILDEIVEIPFEDYSFRPWYWESDIASDSGVDVIIYKCKCGKEHTIER